MFIKEVAASLYAWDLADEGIQTIADNLQEHANCNCMYLVGVMHFEKRPLTSLYYTHNAQRKFYLPENSRAYYRLNLDSFKNTKLKPCFTERDFLKGTDWLDVLTEEARKRGMKTGVELSHTIYDTNIAREKYPEMMQRDVNGNMVQDVQGLLCPNHPDVHEFQRAMFYDSVKNHDVDIVQTCLLTFGGGHTVKAPWFYAPWMNIEDPNLGALLGIADGGCFCEHCRAKAIEWGYDWERIVSDMKKIYAIAHATPYAFQEYLMENNLTLGSNLTDCMLFVEYPGLFDFIKFRIQSMEMPIGEVIRLHEKRNWNMNRREIQHLIKAIRGVYYFRREFELRPQRLFLVSDEYPRSLLEKWNARQFPSIEAAYKAALDEMGKDAYTFVIPDPKKTLPIVDYDFEEV